MAQPRNPANDLSDLPILTEVVDQQSGIPVLTEIVTDSVTPHQTQTAKNQDALRGPLSTTELQQLLRALSPDIEAKLQAELEIYAKILSRQLIKRTLAELHNDPVALQQVLNKALTQGH